MVQVIIEGLVLGLSSGAYCLGACLAFFLPYLVSEGGSGRKESITAVLFFMSGRLVAYIGFAVLIGFLGERFGGVIPAKLSFIALIVVSLLMSAYAVGRNFQESKFCREILSRLNIKHLPFVLGVFLGLNPCLPFLAAVARIWGLGNLFLGVIFFLAFFLGTSLYIIPLFFAGYLSRFERARGIGRMLALLCGLWFLFVGIYGLVK